MLRHEFIIAILLLVGGAIMLTGCNRAEMGESQVRQQPDTSYVAPMAEETSLEQDRADASARSREAVERGMNASRETTERETVR